MRPVARLLVLLCALLGTLGAHPARAQSALSIEAVPVLGPGSPSVDGWGEVYVRLENTGAAALNGFLELRSLGGGRSGPRALSRAPFALAAKARVSLLLPSHSLLTRVTDSKVVAVDERGSELGDVQLPPLRTLDPLLFDLSVPSRLAPVLGAQPMPIKRRGSSFAYGGSTLSVTTPQLDVASGELVLPDLAAGYASATLVLASGRTLSSISAPALDALSSWVLAGGALAVVIDRPEDLHSSWLEAMAGGRVQSSAAARQLAGATSFAVPLETAGRSASAPRIAFESAQPSRELAATFFGLTGANLRASPWGESCSYGLGEVHFLAFNPDTELGAADPWLRLEMVDLVRHAWERASVVALPHGQAGLDDSRGSNVRRVLDPNESTRWTVVVSTLLLLLYAGLAGPLNFYLAQRAGRPLRALVYLPVYAGIALTGIVVLGVLGKGLRGRARHLTLIEAGAGMARASITRFRGLYGARSDDLTVRAARGSVLDVLGEPDEALRDLVVDRDGLRLEKLREKPWQVQVVREDGFSNLAGGVSFVTGSDGRLAVKNRCARDLLSVVIKEPGQDFRYFPKIADGETVSAWRGRRVSSLLSGLSGMATHPLSVASFRDAVEEHAKGAGAAWEALEALTGSDVDWWPSDVPVLIAELEGGEGRTQDSGLRLDMDRVLLRVIGYGGVP